MDISSSVYLENALAHQRFEGLQPSEELKQDLLAVEQGLMTIAQVTERAKKRLNV